jgi:predicted transcriptional regulator
MIIESQLAILEESKWQIRTLLRQIKSPWQPISWPHTFHVTLSLPVVCLLMIESVHSALTNLGAVEPVHQAEPLVPAVSIRKSITPGFLICLDDGKKLKTLKRHLTILGMTPDQYRTKWSLPKDYPMVAPDYAVTRSALAKKMGLGQLRKDTSTRKSGRKPKAKAEKAAS